MHKIQKIGFFASASMFTLTGIIFIITGIKFDTPVLKYMGYFWVPAGLLQVIFLIVYLKFKNPKGENK